MIFDRKSLVQFVRPLTPDTLLRKEKHKMSEPMFFSSPNALLTVGLHHYRMNNRWHVLVGRNFGCYVTHEKSKFIYFYLGQVCVYVFDLNHDANHLVTHRHLTIITRYYQCARPGFVVAYHLFIDPLCFFHVFFMCPLFGFVPIVVYFQRAHRWASACMQQHERRRKSADAPGCLGSSSVWAQPRLVHLRLV